ncbi:hypothetical protein CK203_091821 [Vitis vinifera]|uniref:Uncharacterized protein n=1 Tax=Vitis vinifera TaxID=29760 RepID=A0A438BLX8_VITVI|nr:hypothetical protein CK203_091821 [Vitis vinifera]
MGRFRNLPKLILAGEKKMFGVYRNGMKARVNGTIEKEKILWREVAVAPRTIERKISGTAPSLKDKRRTSRTHPDLLQAQQSVICLPFIESNAHIRAVLIAPQQVSIKHRSRSSFASPFTSTSHHYGLFWEHAQPAGFGQSNHSSSCHFGKTTTRTHLVGALRSRPDRSVKIPRGIIEDVLVQVDNFYYPVDFVVLDTDPIFKEANYVPIILGRPFLTTSNAIINCRNGLMQLTFDNMTLELNIFYMSKKPITLEEDEGLEEVCIIETLVEEHCNQKMQEKLNESLGDLKEGLPKPSDLFATLQDWRRIEEILPLFHKEEAQEVAKEEPQSLI